MAERFELARWGELSVAAAPLFSFLWITISQLAVQAPQRRGDVVFGVWAQSGPAVALAVNTQCVASTTALLNTGVIQAGVCATCLCHTVRPRSVAGVVFLFRYRLEQLYAAKSTFVSFASIWLWFCGVRQKASMTSRKHTN